MCKAILLGDSIFDNASYVPGESAVVDQLNDRLGVAGTAVLLAVDGHVTYHVSGQAERIPDDATHLFVSVGGNDALQAVPVLHQDGSAQSMLAALARVQTNFRKEYSDMLDVVAAKGLPVTVCTIYDSVPDMETLTHEAAGAALSLFNDVIIREASARGIPVIDLRAVCDSVEDYSVVSPIEPSAVGGEKITAAIQQVFRHHDFGSNEARIYC